LEQALAEGGHLQQCEQVDLLALERIPELARWSLALLVLSLVGFISLDIVAMSRQPTGVLITFVTLIILILANMLAYAVMIPLHEAVHAAVILTLGGKPRFGLKLPLAAYCTAPGQLFTRAGYIAVAIAPLMVLSILGIALVWLAPTAGAFIILGLAGNVAGAVGDLVAIGYTYRLPATVLIADTETGFIAYDVV